MYFCLYVEIMHFHAGKTGKSYIFQAFPEQKCRILIGFFLENAGKSQEIEPEKKWPPC